MLKLFLRIFINFQRLRSIRHHWKSLVRILLRVKIRRILLRWCLNILTSDQLLTPVFVWNRHWIYRKPFNISRFQQAYAICGPWANCGTFTFMWHTISSLMFCEVLVGLRLWHTVEGRVGGRLLENKSKQKVPSLKTLTSTTVRSKNKCRKKWPCLPVF